MQSETPGREAWVAALDFLVASGVDLALDETAHDRFAEGDAAPQARAAAPPTPERSAGGERGPPPSLPAVARAAPASPDAIAAEARSLAAQAGSLAELEALAAAFDGCALKASAKQLVFADGVPGFRVMILGEAPGAEEDRTGKPFVGRAGQLLDRMLAAISLDRGSVYIANVVPWRPPGNRTPTPQEVAICLPFTLRQVELARPDYVVTLGTPATQCLLGSKEGITRMRGRWVDHVVGTWPVRVLPMLHPAYLLRQPLHKRVAWRDLRMLRRALDEPMEPRPAGVT